jgi:hypothetical protein
MQKLFGSQVAFYEVPVVVKADKSPLPPTYFVSFSHFRSSIDWSRSKTKSTMRSHLGQTFEIISLVDQPNAAVFEAMPSDQAMIWIERQIKVGNRLYSPGAFDAYATNAAAGEIDEAFPESFLLKEFDEAPARIK